MILSNTVNIAAWNLPAINTPTFTLAREAVQTECVRFIRVKRIQKMSAEPVYNMEVEQYHNFAVNGGLIVHNCIDSGRYALEPEISRRVATTRSDIY